MKTITIYNAEGEEQELFLPTHREVCPTCDGKGTSSAYLGAFSGDDMREDPEFFEDYMAGRYDRTCEECNGLRVIEVVDIDKMPAADRALYEEHMREEASYNSMCEMERRMGA